MYKNRVYYIPQSLNSPPTPPRLGIYEGIENRRHKFTLKAVVCNGKWHTPEDAMAIMRAAGTRVRAFKTSFFFAKLSRGVTEYAKALETPSAAEVMSTKNSDASIDAVGRVVQKLLVRTGFTVEELIEALL